MVSAQRNPIKNTFIYSTIFETAEDIENRPFQFEMSQPNKTSRTPADIPNKLYQGYLLQIQTKAAPNPAGADEDRSLISAPAENNETPHTPGPDGSGSATFFTQSYYVLCENEIIMFDNETATQERGVLNVKNCRLKKHYFKDTTHKYLYGFIVMAKGKTLDFYVDSKEERDNWVKSMKRFVILLDLKDEFIIGRLLGHGNFAKVHLCTRRTDQNTKYALKTMQKQALSKSKRNIQSVLTEIDVLRAIDHENVIQLYETYESTKYIHLLLPYLEGGELFDRIKSKGQYRESTARPVMRNFISALEYLHARNIVHRDLKPENLLLASKQNNWDLKIADFGLATVIEDATKKLYLRCGSPGYVAPELLQEKGYNCQADIFSVGVIFYIVLTGRPLFRGNSPDEILSKNMRCDYQFCDRQWENISEAAKDLVMQLLKENPDERITASQALQHRWFNEDNQDGAGVTVDTVEFQEFDQQKKRMVNAVNPLVSCTPVMAGVRLANAPPETPFLQSNGHTLVDRTPVMARFRPLGQGAAQQAQQQVQVGGLTMNRINHPGAAPANGGAFGQQPNLLQRMQLQKQQPQQFRGPAAIAQGPPGPGVATGPGQNRLAMIPAFKGGPTQPQSSSTTTPAPQVQQAVVPKDMITPVAASTANASNAPAQAQAASSLPPFACLASNPPGNKEVVADPTPPEAAMQDINVILSQKESKHRSRSDSICEASECEENGDSGNIEQVSIAINPPSAQAPSPLLVQAYSSLQPQSQPPQGQQQPTPVSSKMTPNPPVAGDPASNAEESKGPPQALILPAPSNSKPQLNNSKMPGLQRQKLVRKSPKSKRQAKSQAPVESVSIRAAGEQPQQLKSPPEKLKPEYDASKANQDSSKSIAQSSQQQDQQQHLQPQDSVEKNMPPGAPVAGGVPDNQQQNPNNNSLVQQNNPNATHQQRRHSSSMSFKGYKLPYIRPHMMCLSKPKQEQILKDQHPAQQNPGYQQLPRHHSHQDHHNLSIEHPGMAAQPRASGQSGINGASEESSEDGEESKQGHVLSARGGIKGKQQQVEALLEPQLNLKRIRGNESQKRQQQQHNHLQVDHHNQNHNAEQESKKNKKDHPENSPYHNIRRNKQDGSSRSIQQNLRDGDNSGGSEHLQQYARARQYKGPCFDEGARQSNQQQMQPQPIQQQAHQNASSKSQPPSAQSPVNEANQINGQNSKSDNRLINLNDLGQQHADEENKQERRQQSPEEQLLLRSHRYMNFNEKELNEYVSSEEEDDDDLLKNAGRHQNNPSIASDSENDDDQNQNNKSEQQVNKRAQSMIFKPFKPGRQHDALRVIPKSVQKISKKEPLYKLNQRKLPHEIQERQQAEELKQREQRAALGGNVAGPALAGLEQSKDRDANIKAMLAKIPCMSQETIQENRKKIEQQNSNNNVIPQAQQQIPAAQQQNQVPMYKARSEEEQKKHDQLLNQLREQVLESAAKHFVHIQKVKSDPPIESPNKRNKLLGVEQSNPDVKPSRASMQAIVEENPRRKN